MTSKYIQDIKVLGVEKIKKDIAGKRYEFVLRITWSNNTEATIYRPHSMFFDFQGVLAEMFKKEKIPNAPVVKFRWALLGKLGHEKECKSMEEFCLKIIRLPPVVSSASIVLHFFETWGTDLRTNQKSSELFDLGVGRASVQSIQEKAKTAPVSDEKEDQYKVIANYEATNIGEISLTEGSLVTIIEKNERGWWFIGDNTSRQGWAPATYLEPITLGDDDLGYDWVSVVDANGKGEQYIAMISYEAQNNDELSYNAQQRLEVLEKSNYGWWRVRINDKTGITPATNLQRVDDTCIYQSADELQNRTVSISSASGLYAVIRKHPPRRESVRSRSSSGISLLQSPSGSLKGSMKNGLTGKKPSRFVYSATSFAGGKFVIGDEKIENCERDVRPPPADVMNQPEEMYENVDSDSLKKSNSLTVKKTVRSKSTEDALLSIHLNQYPVNGHPSYVNRRFSKPGEGSEVEFYSALLDYTPSGKKKEDITLQKGDIVQLISTDSGWMFVTRLHSDLESKGWVPETYLERRYDIDLEAFSCTENDRKPKPRPRPAPRPKNKPTDSPSSSFKRPPAPPRRVSLAEVMENRPLPPINHSADQQSNVVKKSAKRPPLPGPLLNDIQHIRNHEEDREEGEEDFYDEPEMKLRSVYDCEPWYFGNVSRVDAERILGTYGRQLEFLIRDSRRLIGSYALSIKYCYRIRHFPIKLTKDNKYQVGTFTFPNLMDIIAHYQKNPLFYSEHMEPIVLGKCFPKENYPK